MVSVMPLADVSMNLGWDVEFIVEGSEFRVQSSITDVRRPTTEENGHRLTGIDHCAFFLAMVIRSIFSCSFSTP
jgi:hypothetical protein